MKTITLDDITELKYKIVADLVLVGLIPDCTDTDDEFEIDAENSVEDTLNTYFNI